MYCTTCDSSVSHLLCYRAVVDSGMLVLVSSEFYLQHCKRAIHTYTNLKHAPCNITDTELTILDGAALCESVV